LPLLRTIKSTLDRPLTHLLPAYPRSLLGRNSLEGGFSTRSHASSCVFIRHYNISCSAQHFAEADGEISRVSGREVHYVPISVEQFASAVEAFVLLD
jgi:hypothetical protein